MLLTRQITLPIGGTESVGKSHAIRITPLAGIRLTTLINDYGLIASGRALVFTATDASGNQAVIGLDHRGLPWTVGPFFGGQITNNTDHELVIDVEITTGASDPLTDPLPFALIRKPTNAQDQTIVLFPGTRKRLAINTYLATAGVASKNMAIGAHFPRSFVTVALAGGFPSWTSTDTDRGYNVVFGSDAADVTVAPRESHIPSPPPPILAIVMPAGTGGGSVDLCAWGS